MPRRKKKDSRLSEFEIALKKGDFQLPSELPREWTFEDALEAFLTFYERIGCPGTKDLYWLGIWKALYRDKKKTAAALPNLTEEAIKKRLARLKKSYKKGNGAALAGPKRPKKPG